MITLSCRLDDEFYARVDRRPVPGADRKLEAKLTDNKVMMRATKKDGTKVDISKVALVRIDWGMVCGSEQTTHPVRMCKVTRAVADAMGSLDYVVENVEPFIEIETAVGFSMLVPLFESGLYRRVVAFKEG